jgi:hypothetical protein
MHQDSRVKTCNADLDHGHTETMGKHTEEKQKHNGTEQDQNAFKLLLKVSFQLFSAVIEPAVHSY